MCFNALSLLRLHASSSGQHTQEASLDFGMTSMDKDTVWCFAFSIMGRMIGYIALLGVMVVIVSLVLKWIGECGEEHHQERTESEAERGEEPHEAAPLLPAQKTIRYSYGTYQQPQQEKAILDIEAGDCSKNSSCSEEDYSSRINSGLYDGKICIICYDEPRNCFFVPCGHNGTCYDCAQRIYYDEGRVCPVCRRYIGKIRRL